MNTTAIAADLDLCDLVDAFGSRAAKNKARKQRRVIFAAIHAQNVADGIADMSDDELLAALAA